MSFSVRISADLVSVEAGATVPLSIEIANRSDDVDRFEMEIEGLDPDWTAVPVPTFSVDPRDLQAEKVFFKPPRVSESLAGTYPFVVRVRSLVSGELRTAQGVFEIKPYHHLTMELSPKKGVFSAMKKANGFQATVMNLGNTGHTLRLFATDPEDALAYEFDQEQFTVGPGQTKTVQVAPRPTDSRPFASSRLHGFTVSARSVEAPSVMCSAQGQLEQRPVLSPSAILLIVIFGLVFAGWYALLPKPPRVDSLSLNPPTPVRGSQVTVEWTSSNATSVRLTINGQVYEGLKANGSMPITALDRGTVEAVAVRESKTSAPVSRAYVSSEPPTVPDPVIEQFRISPRQVKLGENLLVNYKLSGGVSKATLTPVGLDVDPDLTQATIVANLPGEITYKLVVENSAGKTVEKSFKVSVVQGSEASIVVYRVNPTQLPEEGGAVTVTWQLTKAERVELRVGNETFEVDPGRGSRDFIVTTTTEFTITAYDSTGKTIAQTRKVEVARPPTLEPPPDGVKSGDGLAGVGGLR